jgi:hypothetical protein
VKANLSPALQREFSMLGSSVVRNVWWAQLLEDDARLALVEMFDAIFYAPREAVADHLTMVIVHSGLIGASGRVLGRGDAWGHDNVLLESQRLIQTDIPMSLGYVEVGTLTRSQIIDLLNTFASAKHRLRRATTRLAVLRGFCLSAKASFNSFKTELDLSEENEHRRCGLLGIACSSKLEAKELLPILTSKLDASLATAEMSFNNRLESVIRTQHEITRRLDQCLRPAGGGIVL